MKRTIVIACGLLAVSCGGQIAGQDPGDGAASGARASSSSTGSGSDPSAGPSGTGGAGSASASDPSNGSNAGSGSGSAFGAQGGPASVSPTTGLALGQCTMSATGTQAFMPELTPRTGGAGGVLGGSGRAQLMWCEVQADADYRVSFDLADRSASPTSATATLFRRSGCGCVLCDCTSEQVATLSCTLTTRESDLDIFDASYDCVSPLEGGHLEGALYFRPIPDTLK